jgi:hypothetical protein
MSFRIIEVAVDTFLLSFFVPITTALWLSVVIEFACFAMHFGFERVWNRINYGRAILKKEDEKWVPYDNS